MKKKMKSVFITIIVVAILLGIICVIVISNTEPKYLECYDDISNTTVDIKEDVNLKFYFDEKNIIKNYLDERTYTYTTKEEANEYYKYFLENKDLKVEKEGRIITTSINYEMKENEGYYGKTSEEIKSHYEKEFNYSCKWRYK